eukprot:scaffold1525_cov142-Cylindrotheca_fusiformis.AAC.106
MMKPIGWPFTMKLVTRIQKVKSRTYSTAANTLLYLSLFLRYIHDGYKQIPERTRPETIYGTLLGDCCLFFVSTTARCSTHSPPPVLPKIII